MDSLKVYRTSNTSEKQSTKCTSCDRSANTLWMVQLKHIECTFNIISTVSRVQNVASKLLTYFCTKFSNTFAFIVLFIDFIYGTLAGRNNFLAVRLPLSKFSVLLMCNYCNVYLYVSNYEYYKLGKEKNTNYELCYDF